MERASSGWATLAAKRSSLARFPAPRSRHLARFISCRVADVARPSDAQADRMVLRRSIVSAPRRVVRMHAETIGPVVHHQQPPLKQVRPRVRRLHLVLHHMHQRRVDDLPRVVGLLRRPIPERRPEAVGNGRDPVQSGASSAASTPRFVPRRACPCPGRHRARRRQRNSRQCPKHADKRQLLRHHAEASLRRPRVEGLGGVAAGRPSRKSVLARRVARRISWASISSVLFIWARCLSTRSASSPFSSSRVRCSWASRASASRSNSDDERSIGQLRGKGNGRRGGRLSRRRTAQANSNAVRNWPVRAIFVGAGPVLDPTCRPTGRRGSAVPAGRSGPPRNSR